MTYIRSQLHIPGHNFIYQICFGCVYILYGCGVDKILYSSKHFSPLSLIAKSLDKMQTLKADVI